MMADYWVHWEIEAVNLDSPLAAAQWAERARTRPESNVYTMTNQATGQTTRVDLLDGDKEEVTP